MSFRKGEARILFIKDNGFYKPIGCLVSNDLEEDVEMLDTTTRIADGWKTGIPTKQSYRIPIDGIQCFSGSGILSYQELKRLKRNRQRVEWAIGRTSTNLDEEGYGHITQLGEGNQVGEFLTFTAEIEGWGQPRLVITDGDIWQDGEAMLFQDGNAMIFQDG